MEIELNIKWIDLMTLMMMKFEALMFSIIVVLICLLFGLLV